MSTITAAEVNNLRKQTGAGMMDCKKALVEAEGDFEKAVELLRKKGQKVAAKRGDKDATEGLVLAKTLEDQSKGIIVVVNCETDFVAKNEDFVQFVDTIASRALQNLPADISALKSLEYEAGLSIEEKILEQVGKIGEKIDISDYSVVEAPTVVAYNHPGNQIASLVALNKNGGALGEVARDLAMQVAAMSPISVDQSGVPQDVIDKEIEIGKEQAREEGKPEELLEKIAQGKLNKFYKESTLINQEFIKDGKKSVGQYLKEVDSDLAVASFKRMALK